MRTLSKPSTAKCTLEHYTAFLLAEPQSAGCVRLAKVAGGVFTHDAANRFLNREAFSGPGLVRGSAWAHGLGRRHLERGRHRAGQARQPGRQDRTGELVGYFWTGKRGRALKGLCLVTLLYTDGKGVCLHINFRKASYIIGASLAVDGGMIAD